jgi:hypothetical protein
MMKTKGLPSLDSPLIFQQKNSTNFPHGCPGAEKHLHPAHRHGHRDSREKVSSLVGHGRKSKL